METGNSVLRTRVKMAKTMRRHNFSRLKKNTENNNLQKCQYKVLLFMIIIKCNTNPTLYLNLSMNLYRQNDGNQFSNY